MEHLVRNTNNDRIIYTIEQLKRENQENASNKIKEMADKVVNVIVGVFSALLSTELTNIITKNFSKCVILDILLRIFLLLVAFVVIWYISVKFLVPFFYKRYFREKVDITPEKLSISVKRFNTEIIQKVSEINEVVEVINQTDIVECKRLNFVISLYKMQEIVDFMYEKFGPRPVEMRKTEADGSVELFRYSFNVYAVDIVLKTVIVIRGKMKELLKDDAIKSLEGYSLLSSDFTEISKKLDKIEIKDCKDT